MEVFLAVAVLAQLLSCCLNCGQLAQRSGPGVVGGWRQRMASAEYDAEDAPLSGMSRLFGRLLLEWCNGRCSAAKLHTFAAEALRDGLHHPMIAAVAAAGANQHSHESIMGLLAACGVQDNVSAFPEEAGTDMLLPSTWPCVLCHRHGRRWRLCTGH